MSVSKNIEIVLDAFRAVERRDEQRLIELYHPEVEFHWPPSLPYGGSFRGQEELEARQGGWGQTWGPLQPTEAERRMEPRVVAANDDGEVVVLWRQRGVSPTGERFDGEALGLYQVREGKFARAQMFYFDTAAVLRFLERARREQEAAQRTVSKLPDAGR